MGQSWKHGIWAWVLKIIMNVGSVRRLDLRELFWRGFGEFKEVLGICWVLKNCYVWNKVCIQLWEFLETLRFGRMKSWEHGIWHVVDLETTAHFSNCFEFQKVHGPESMLSKVHEKLCVLTVWILECVSRLPFESLWWVESGEHGSIIWSWSLVLFWIKGFAYADELLRVYLWDSGTMHRLPLCFFSLFFPQAFFWVLSYVWTRPSVLPRFKTDVP